MRSRAARGRTIVHLAVGCTLVLVLGGIAAHAQEKVLVNFPPQYRFPSASLAADSAFNLYGTTSFGTNSSGTVINDGAAFELSPTSTGDGALPFSTGLVFGKGGLLYGVTGEGGTGKCVYIPTGSSIGCGTVYEVKPQSGVGLRRYLAGREQGASLVYRYFVLSFLECSCCLCVKSVHPSFLDQSER